MGRKSFRDFAHVMCQMFIESPSNRDLVNLSILGSGQLVLRIMEGRATHNDIAIDPLPFAEHWRSWAITRMAEAKIDVTQLVAASLTADYEVQLSRKAGIGWLCADFTFKVSSLVQAPDRDYAATLDLSKEWGLSCL